MSHRVRRSVPVIILAFGAIGGVLLAVMLLTRWASPVGQGSPSAPTSPSVASTSSLGESDAPSDAPTVAPTATPRTVAGTPVPDPRPITGWALAGTVGTDEQRPTFVFDATVWRGTYVAVGARFDRFASDSAVYTGQPLLWTSISGDTWAEKPLLIDLPDGDQVDARVEHVLALADGRLMVIYAHGSELLSWVSTDAESWDPVDIGISAWPEDVAEGPRGYVLVASQIEPGGHDRWQLWYSADGVAWSLMREEAVGSGIQLSSVDAGPEGFVVVGARRTDTDRAYVLASADGATWFEAPEQEAFQEGDFPIDVAALGADWLATGFGAEQADQRAVVWRSADGLGWTRDVGPVDPDGRDSYYATDVAGDGGHVVLSPALSAIGGPFQFPTYAWSTTDGDGWSTLLPNESYVTEVVSNGSTVVAVGNLGRGRLGAFWVGVTD